MLVTIEKSYINFQSTCSSPFFKSHNKITIKNKGGIILIKNVPLFSSDPPSYVCRVFFLLCRFLRITKLIRTWSMPVSGHLLLVWYFSTENSWVVPRRLADHQLWFFFRSATFPIHFHLSSPFPVLCCCQYRCSQTNAYSNSYCSAKNFGVSVHCFIFSIYYPSVLPWNAAWPNQPFLNEAFYWLSRI